MNGLHYQRPASFCGKQSSAQLLRNVHGKDMLWRRRLQWTEVAYFTLSLLQREQDPVLQPGSCIDSCWAKQYGQVA